MSRFNATGTDAKKPAPYDILTARTALVEAARLNKKAVALESEGSQCMAAWVADVALSLATYALALKERP